MSFELSGLNNVIDEIEHLWDKLGLSSEEKNQEKGKLDFDVMKVFIDFKKSLEKRCLEIESQIKETISNHIKLLSSFPETEPIIQKLKSTQYEPTKPNLALVVRCYEEDKIKYQKILEKIEYLKSEVIRLFTLLEIPDSEKGEFSNIDNITFDSLTIQRLETYVTNLSQEASTRQKHMLEINSQISLLSTELELDIPNEIVNLFITNSLSTQSVMSVDSYLQFLEEKKSQRIVEITKMANEITNLWNILEVPEDTRNKFLQSHSTLGPSVLKSCVEEIERLKQIRNKRLPILIEIQRNEINELCSYLHLSSQCTTSNDLEETFEANELEIKRLNNLRKKMEPFIEIITKREEMIEQINKITEKVIAAIDTI
ncbi:65-kDa microtubule-associated protein 1 [Histomonas meleagridis]|uniref:65-kDa microtubule-associated protein 1 n=1 Tax=Histomonas meleagridis TaxID=135588 RepID=UPI00355A0288|nr:65-kDa microtubule-associated protein 1 [Histomonas meleagridis]KAH0797038.1 65-kDa microtubule-associated protein 1 [Histomonas meleagridis]